MKPYIALFIALFLTPLHAAEPVIFHSTLADQGWYQANPTLLKQDLNSLLLTASVNAVSNPIAIIMPHAGYGYSGSVMASGIKAIQKSQFDRIIVIGPSHHQELRNQAAVLLADKIETPMGLAPLDQKAIRYLLSCKEIVNRPDLHPKEHSVQIEIPWIQMAFAHTPIVPIVLGQIESEYLPRFASILRPLLTPKTLLIISSDFTHYGEGYGYVPFKEPIFENIQRLDATALQIISRKKLFEFQSFIDKTGDTICGHMPIQLLLELLPDNALPHQIAYRTSAEINGDWSHSVSYDALVFSGSWKEDGLGLTYPQTEKEGKICLAYVRQCINTYLGKESAPAMPTLSPSLNQKRSVFVTLKKNGQLRGCIGSIFPSQSLVDEIRTQAINAAVNDPRFPPLSQPELKECRIELSILSAIKPCNSYLDIRLGKDGIILKKGSHQALFLPQVARDQDRPWQLIVIFCLQIR